MLNYKLQQSTHLKLVINSTNKESAMNEKYKILVVDDHPINIKVAQLFLNRLGYVNITVAENGKKALELINDDFDVILLDIGLPDISGFDVCTAIRQKLIKKIPVIAVTAIDANDEFYEKCKLAGIDDVINKPFSIDDLKLKIEQWSDKYKEINQRITSF